MTDELTSAGLTIDSFEVRLAALNAALRAAISANLDLSTDQPTGQLTKIQTEKIQAVMELVRAINVSWHPDSATGASLTALAAVTGTQRRAATYGHVILDCNIDGATTLSAGAVAAVSGDATNRWVTDEDLTTLAGPAAQYDVAATCESVGPIAAALGTITVRASGDPGWNNVDNAAAATAGLAEETDTALRIRREYEIALGGSTSVDAIRAELLDLTGMVQAFVTENTTAGIVDTLPPHSFESVLWDGAAPAVLDEDIAEAIFVTKAGGIEAFGTTSSRTRTSRE